MSDLKEKRCDYLVLVNEDKALPENYEQTVELVSYINELGKELLIERKTLEAFLKLKEDVLKNDGIEAEISSVYRDIKSQQEIYDKYLVQFGEEYAKKYVAFPGHSEHHTGLAIDIAVKANGEWTQSIEARFEVEHLFKTIQSKLPSYGFILRYPKGKEHITKIGYESWHFRYIDSPEIAKEITDKGITMEEYFAK